MSIRDIFAVTSDSRFRFLSDLRGRHIAFLLPAIALLFVPYGVDVVTLTTFIGVFYLMMFAMSWDVVSGYTGQISLGHSMFFAIGGYSTAILNTQHGISPVFSIPGAILIGALAGILIGIPALRIRGPYLSLLTLVIPVILMQMLILFNDQLPYLAPDGLGGTAGITESPTPLIGTQDRSVLVVQEFETLMIGEYYLSLALLAAVFALLYLVTRSDIGDILTAVRENEHAVENAGINPTKFKVFAFVLSASVGALAGAVYVHTSVAFPQPSVLLDVSISLNIVIMAVIGGMGTITGAAIGAMFFKLVTTAFTLDSLQFQLPLVNETIGGLIPLPLFALGVLILLYFPDGIVGATIRFGERIFPEERF